MSSFTLAIKDLTTDIHVRSFTGEEGISQLFRLQVLVDISGNASGGAPIRAADLLGRDAVFGLELDGVEVRKFLATISSVEELGTDEHLCAVYELELVPRLWPLVQTVRSRVFEGLEALEIVEQVFKGSGIQLEFPSPVADQTRPYCVQYFESDFDFVVRLLEEEGYIYLYGWKANDQATSGGDNQYVPTFAVKRVPSSFPSLGSLTFDETGGGPEERIRSWQKVRKVTATTLTARDHFFQANPPVLEASATVPASIPGWESLNGRWSASVDRYPGQWAHLFELVPTSGQAATSAGYIDFGNNNRAPYQLRQAAGSCSFNAGASNCLRLAAGSAFELANRPQSELNLTHLVVSVRHKGSQGLQHSSAGNHGFEYENQFTSVPYAGTTAGTTMMYLPPRSTRKPVIHGCQTAIVVSASETEEISTDMYGRVQVQFWWDRGNTRSCWVRVATSWAGSNWGVQHVPRVGQEVVVTFLDGDPDRPLIVGSVYNPSNMPPFSLPKHQTQSGIRTHSTPKGGPGESNEIRFEDAKGAEEIYIHAQKDRREVVENDAKRNIGNDCRSQIDNDRFDLVVGDVHVKTGGEKREAVVGNSSLTVGGDCMIAIAGKEGDTATGGKLGIAARDKIHLKAPKIVIEADSISIRTTESGREFIHLEKGSGITIDSKGDQVWINTGGAGSPEDGCFKEESVLQPLEPFPPPTPDPPAPPPLPFPFDLFPFGPFNPFPKPAPSPSPKPLPVKPWDLKK